MDLFWMKHWPALGLVLLGVLWLFWYESKKNDQKMNVQDAVLVVNNQKGLIIDIRRPEDYHAGHAPGAVLADPTWAQKGLPASISKRPIMVACYRGVSAVTWLANLPGRDSLNAWVLEGGMEAWKEAGFPLEITR